MAHFTTFADSTKTDDFGPEKALAADRTLFASGDSPPLSAEVVAAGASARRFFRIRDARGSRILMRYPLEKEENRYFAGIGGRLYASGVPVPRILLDLPERGMVWMEDLGDRDLFSLGESSERPEAYRKAIRVMVAFQRLSPAFFEEHGVTTLSPFDEGLYRFEQEYFRREFLDRLAPRVSRSGSLREEMEDLLLKILEDPRPTVWVHRDFQSKNLLLDSAGGLRIVDFQGFRRGHPYYDLASLLEDPYVDLPPALRKELFEEFCNLWGKSVKEEFVPFARLRCQRLLQALGAYGKFGLGAGVSFFQSRIPSALRSLAAAAKHAELPELRKLAEELVGG